MKLSKDNRAELLSRFQQYLDDCKISDPERRERLCSLFLVKALSLSTEREFVGWMRERRRPLRQRKPTTRTGKLWTFATWLKDVRGILNEEERDRYCRLYTKRMLSRAMTTEFHRFMRDNAR